MLNRSFVQQNHSPPRNYSTPAIPTSPGGYYPYQQEIPVQFSSMPHNMSPPRVYEQYSKPITRAEKKSILIKSPSPRTIRGYADTSNPSDKKHTVFVKSPPPIVQPMLSLTPRAENRNIVSPTMSPTRFHNQNVFIGTPQHMPINDVIMNQTPPRMLPLKTQKLIPMNNFVMNHSPPRILPIGSKLRTSRDSDNNEDLIVGLKAENERLSFILKEKEGELNSFREKCLHMEQHVNVNRSTFRNNLRIQVNK